MTYYYFSLLDLIIYSAQVGFLSIVSAYCAARFFGLSK